MISTYSHIYPNASAVITGYSMMLRQGKDGLAKRVGT
jgi:hypothetical protein